MNHQNTGEEVIEPDVEPTRSEEAIAFGNWLRECRERDNMNSDDVAQIVGCTAGYIRYIEAGFGMPGQNLREALTALFDDFSDYTTETIPDNPILVKMPDGASISKNTGIDTFIEVIKVIGIEEVKELDLFVNTIPLIADCCDEDGRAQREVETETGTYLIVSGTDRKKKKTNINDALRVALAEKPDPNRPRIIVFLTDGCPTAGVTNPARILENVAKVNKNLSRIFVFGVGYDVNDHLLDKMEADNGGTRNYVTPITV